MTPVPSRSLQARLLVLVLGLMSALWLLAATLVWFDTRHELDELLDGHLAQAAAIVVAQQAADIDDDMFERAPALHRYAPRVAFQVWHEGELVMRSADAPGVPLARLERGFADTVIDGVQWRVFADVGTQPPTQVYVAEHVAARRDILWAVMRSVLWPLALALPLLALGAWWSVRSGLAPLRSLSKLVGLRAPDDMQPVDVPAAPTEMQPLLGSLNRLFERIGELLESERRFTADAAHELRTPIAAIRTQAQVALGEADDLRRRHALQSTLAGCDRAAHLVEQLLTLARLEGGARPTLGRCDLARIARLVMADLASASPDLAHELDCVAPDVREVAAVETLVAVLLRNLVDNALRYSPRGATVRVTVHDAAAEAQQGALLDVEDSGPGLSDADMTRLGERFFRALGHEASGSGLGLSIVRRVATVLRWQVRFDRSPALGGLRVRVSRGG